MNAPDTFATRGGAELAGLQGMWAFLVGMGIVLMALGVAAVGSSFDATFATVTVFGVLMLLGAILQLVTALWGRSWRRLFLHLPVGVLYAVVGTFMIENPVKAALGLTFLIAACLLAGGLLRIGLSVVEQFEGWGGVLLNGVVSVVLGLAIWRQWPLSGLWVIGLFVGVEMLFSGLSWVMLGLAVRPDRSATPPN